MHFVNMGAKEREREREREELVCENKISKKGNGDEEKEREITERKGFE